MNTPSNFSFLSKHSPLLAKAFRGELVPQDPADEPAAELLRRLAAQHETEPRPKTRGRKPAGALA